MTLSLIGVGTPAFFACSLSTPFIESTSHFLPFSMSYSMLGLRVLCFFMARGIRWKDIHFFIAPE